RWWCWSWPRWPSTTCSPACRGRRSECAGPGFRSGSCSGGREPAADLAGDRQLLLVDHVVAGRHHLGVERHLDGHGGKRLRHERENGRIVVAQVVAPEERVVDTSPVEAGDVAFEVAEVATEKVDLVLGLAAVLPRQEAAGGDSNRVEAEGAGSVRREQFRVAAERVQRSDRLIAC